jgi:hypothetical protein
MNVTGAIEAAQTLMKDGASAEYRRGVCEILALVYPGSGRKVAHEVRTRDLHRHIGPVGELAHMPVHPKPCTPFEGGVIEPVGFSPMSLSSSRENAIAERAYALGVADAKEGLS